MVKEEYFFSLELFPSLGSVMFWSRQIQKIQELWYLFYTLKGLNQILEELTSCKVSTMNDILSFIKGVDREYFEAIIVKLDSFYPELEKRLQEASVQSQCKLCYFVFDSNPPLSELIVESMQKELTSGIANNIREALPPLNGIRKIITLEEFFASFWISDWENIIKNSSTFDSIYNLLCNDFKKWELDNVTKNLAEALLKMDTKCLITQKGASTYRLYGVIKRAQELGLDVKPLVSGIIQSDVYTLRELFLIQKRREVEGHEEPRSAFLFGLNGITSMAEELELKVDLLIENLSKFTTAELKDLFLHCDLEVINQFLSQPATQNPSSCLNIIKKVGDNVWSDLISSFLSNHEQDIETEIKQVYRLFWNIYRYNKSSAKRISERTRHPFVRI